MTTIVYQRSFFADTNGLPLDSGSLYIGVANQDPQTNPIQVYWDSALSVPATQPLTITSGYVTNAGNRAAMYVAPDSYSLRARNKSGTQVDYVAATGSLSSGTINLSNSLGTLQSGSTNAMQFAQTASQGASDGTSQFYSLVNRVYAQGGNNYAYVRANYSGTHIDTTGGTVTNADGLHQYVWLSGAGNVTYSQVVAAHVRADGPGDITNEAINFRAVSTTLGATASIATIKGFSAGQLGDATKVTNVYSFDAEDTAASSVVIGYRSQISSGTNKYQFFGAGTAASAFGGFVGVGMTSTPLWPLSVTYGAGGSWGADFNNSSAASPFGIRVRYTAAAPNDTDHAFISFEDSGTTRYQVLSNGQVNINGSRVLANRQAAVTAPTGGATIDSQARTAINDLIARLQAHGLIA